MPPATLHSSDRRQDRISAWVAKVTGAPTVALIPVSEDASFRRYFRFRRKPRSFIVMDAPPPMEQCHPFAELAARLSTAGVRAPRIIAADLDRGFLLLEDFGDVLLLDQINRQVTAAVNTADDTVLENIYQIPLLTLLQMQTTVQANDLATYDNTLIRHELALFTDWLLTRHLCLSPEPGFDRAFTACSDALVTVFTEQPQVFVHRDYHSRNLMCLPDGDLGVLDFQDAIKGPVSYDIVSLLRDVYVRWPRTRVEGWVYRCWEQWLRSGGISAGVDWKTFLRWFDLTGVQRHIKIAGIFARLFHRDGKQRYLSDLPCTLNYLLEVGDRYAETAPLCKELKRYSVVERTAEANLKARNG